MKRKKVESKSSRRIESKSDLKNLALKSTIKEVNLSELDLNNREALEAVKKCTANTFINTIDLSNNPVTSELVILLKRQKVLGKHLKRILIGGMKINDSGLKKEGINA